MKLEIILDDRSYVSLDINEMGYAEAAKQLFDNMPITECYSMHLESGGILVLGKRAVQKAHFKFLPSTK